MEPSGHQCHSSHGHPLMALPRALGTFGMLSRNGFADGAGRWLSSSMKTEIFRADGCSDQGPVHSPAHCTPCMHCLEPHGCPVAQSISTVRWSDGNKACRECHCLPRALLTVTAACAHCSFMLSLDPMELLVISESNKSKP